MTHPLSKLVVGTVPTDYLSEGFKRLLEDHIPYIKSTRLQAYAITEEQNERAVGDFYSLLLEEKVPIELHWITLRINDMTTPADYKGNYAQFAVPAISTISSLLQKYRARSSSS